MEIVEAVLYLRHHSQISFLLFKFISLVSGTPFDNNFHKSGCNLWLGCRYLFTTFVAMQKDRWTTGQSCSQIDRLPWRRICSKARDSEIQIESIDRGTNWHYWEKRCYEASQLWLHCKEILRIHHSVQVRDHRNHALAVSMVGGIFIFFMTFRSSFRQIVENVHTWGERGGSARGRVILITYVTR